MMKSFRLLAWFFVLILQMVQADELKPDLTVMIPMRDGYALSTDLYLPSPEARHLPCILLRSPAGRNAPSWKPFAAMAKAGYVVAIQDTRSALDHEGKTFPFISDGWGKLQDGYDTVEWLANSPYTDGKIGTWGSSALGITQLLMAPSNPPHLKCQYIMFAAASLYHHGLFPGGQFLKNQAEGWLGLYAPDTGVLNYVSQRPFYNEFWHQLNSLDIAHRVQVPGIHVGGWYDTFLQGTLEGFSARQVDGGEGAKGQQKLVIGPWTHYWPLDKSLGDFKVPESGYAPPYDISPKSWFDYYLKGEKNDIGKLPNVIYYVMGPFDGSPSKGNVWRTSEVWPVPSTPTRLYLTSAKTMQKDVPDTGVLTYLHDPKEPIPTLGGHNLFLKSGPTDQSRSEGRSDVLVFSTPPLKEDIEVTGDIMAKIYFTSDRKDTDIIVRLTDVYPDGKSLLITEGAYRLATMNLDFEPNKPIEATIDLWSTSLVIAKGHKIRVSVCSSCYPRFEKNMNVGLLGTHTGDCEVARNTVFFGKDFPSQIILPVVQ